MAKNKKKKQEETRDIAHRESVLKSALEAVTTSRNQSYGEPQDDFACTSELWDSYITRLIQVRGFVNLQPHDISAMMILLKISRLANSPGETDHWVDIAGYAAIGSECADEIDTPCCE